MEFPRVVSTYCMFLSTQGSNGFQDYSIDEEEEEEEEEE